MATGVEEDPFFYIAFFFLITTVVCGFFLVVQIISCFFCMVIVVLVYQLFLERKARLNLMKINEEQNELRLPDDETEPLLRNLRQRPQADYTILEQTESFAEIPSNSSRNGKRISSENEKETQGLRLETQYIPLILRKIRLEKYSEHFSESSIQSLKNLIPRDATTDSLNFNPRTPELESVIVDEGDLSYFCSFLKTCCGRIEQEGLTNLNEEDLFRIFLNVAHEFRTGSPHSTLSRSISSRPRSPSSTSQPQVSPPTSSNPPNEPPKEQAKKKEEERVTEISISNSMVEESFSEPISPAPAIFFAPQEVNEPTFKMDSAMIRFREIKKILLYLELDKYSDNFENVKIEDLLDLESDPERLDELIPPTDEEGKKDQRNFLLFLEHSSNELEEREMNDDEFEMDRESISSILLELAKKSSLGKDEKEEETPAVDTVPIIRIQSMKDVPSENSINQSGRNSDIVSSLGYGSESPVFSPGIGGKTDAVFDTDSSPEFEEDFEEEEEEEEGEGEEVEQPNSSGSGGAGFASVDVMDILFGGEGKDEEKEEKTDDEVADFVPIRSRRNKKPNIQVSPPNSEDTEEEEEEKPKEKIEHSKEMLDILDSLKIGPSQNISKSLNSRDDDDEDSSDQSDREDDSNETNQDIESRSLEEVNMSIDTYYCPIPQKRSFDPEVIAKRGPIINQGSYGQIQLIYLDLGGDDLIEACEKIIAYSKTGNTKKAIKREVSILKQLKHPHLLNCFGSYSKGETEERIVLEYCSGGDLFSKKKVFQLGQKLRAILEVVEGMAFLHSKGIVHRDLKPQNIFITSKGSCKIGDFGTSTAKEKAGASLVGTVEYLAPEIMDVSLIIKAVKKVIKGGSEELQSVFGKEKHKISAELKKYCDLYSFGIILWELLSDRQPYVRLRKKSRNNQFEMMNKINRKNIRPNVNRVDDFGLEEIKFLKVLMAKCWDRDILKRPRGFEDIKRSLKENGITEEFIERKFGVST